MKSGILHAWTVNIGPPKPTITRLSLHSHPLDVKVSGNELQFPLSF